MILSPLLALTQFRVFLVCKRIVAKVDSMGLVVRMCWKWVAGNTLKSNINVAKGLRGEGSLNGLEALLDHRVVADIEYVAAARLDQ